MKKHYITAILEMIKAGQSPDEVLTGLSKVLKAKGHEQLKAAILRGVLRILEAESDRRVTVIVLAKKDDAARYQAAIAKALSELDAEANYQVAEDATIIGGFVAKAKNTTYDASYKTQLVKLYRDITT